MNIHTKILTVLSSNIMSAILAFITNVFLLRFYPKATSGDIIVFYSYVLVLGAIIEFGCGNSFIVFKSHGCNLLLLINIFISIFFVVSSISALFYYCLVHWTGADFIESFWLVNISAFCYAIYRLMLAILQSAHNFKIYGACNYIINALRLISVVAFYFIVGEKLKHFNYGFSIKLLFSLCILFTVFFGAFQLRKLIEENKEFLNKNNLCLSFILKGTAIYALITFIPVIIMRIDPILIQKLFSTHEVAVYNAATTLALLIPLATTAITSVYIPEVASNNLSIKDIVGHQFKLIPFVFLFIIFLYFSADTIINIIYGNDFYESGKLFFYLASCFALSSLFTPFESYFLVKQKKISLYLRLIQLIVYLTTIFVFYDILGLYSFVLAAFLSRIISWVYTSYLVVKSKKEINCA